MAITYFKGDKAVYTGSVLQIHGGTFYEVVMLEGIHEGEKKVVKYRPHVEMEPYLLPDGSAVSIHADVSRGAAVITYTMADGKVVEAVRA